MKKKLLAGLCALVLAFTFGLGAIAYLPTQTAYAATVQANLSISLPSEVEYMSEVTVPADSVFTTLSVTAPNGKTVTLDGGKFTADQIGNYVVTYKNDAGLSYSFRIYSSIEEDFELVVKNDYSIPTIVKKGATLTLPVAEVGYYDEDGNWVKDESATYEVEPVTATVAEGVATFADAGSAFLTYVAKVMNGTKVLTKTYEVKVQEEFEDKKAPTLSVSNVPSSGNTNMAVTLPKATATDTYDDNVQVAVTVKKNGVNVKTATVDDNGIGSIADGAQDAIFDNANNMTFYPAEDGDYKVTYQAIDDSNNKSAEWTYTITVSDKKAPVMTIDNTIIPAKWGYETVTNIADDADATLKFPVPEFYDNKDKAEDVVIEVTIKDPEAKTVVKFDNINKAEAPKYTNAQLNKELTYKKDGKTFTVDGLNYKEYVDAVKSADYQAEGDYTITYSAKDARGNKSTKSYTINLSAEFVDEAEVSATFKSYEKNIVVKGNKVEYTVPTAVCTSAVDSNLTVAYTANGLEVKAGEIVTIEKTNTGYALVTENGSEDITANTLDFVVTATSDAGNSATATATVTIVTPDTYTYSLNGVVDATGLTADADKHSVQGVIVVPNVVKHAVGVELGIMNEEGEYLTSFEAEVVSLNQSGTYGYAIRNISFAGGAGKYYLVVSAYDIAGGRKTSITEIVVGDATSSDDVIVVPTAALNVDSANANAAINFANNEIKISKSEMTAAGFTYDASAHALAVARVIKGGKFAIIGDTMTAMNEGAYSVTEKLVVLDLNNDGADVVVGDDMKALLDSKKTSSTVVVSDNDAVKLEVQGEAMPSYSALNATVTVPTVAAYTTSANAKEIEFKVTAPDGTDVKVLGDGKDTAWNFVTAQNGTYTMTFTAKVGNKEDATFTYNLKAGDLIAPVITVTGSHATTMKAGESEFAYLKVTATDGTNGTELKDLTFTKTVYGPDGSVVGTQISGKGETYANKTAPSTAFTLDESGKYTVKYTVTDAAGNVATKEFEITVTSTTGNSGISLAALSTILIVVGVLLIAGVIVYLFRFRKVDKSKKN